MNRPAETDSNSRRHLAVVGTGVVLAAFFVALARASAVPVVNTDTFFHLRLGHEFLADWAPSEPGRVSSFGSAEWLPTQWLGQIGLAAVEGRYGLAGVSVLTSLVIVLFGAVVFVTARRHTSFPVAAVLTPVAVVACSPALSGRPQVLSYMFVALITSAWITARERGTVPWWIIPATWLWAMLHGMWPLGVVISLTAATGLALDRAVSPRRSLRYFAVPVLATLAAGLTPVGPGIYGAVAKVTSISSYFAEWATPALTQFPDVLGLAIAGLVGLLALRSEKRTPWTVTALVALAVAFLLHSNRTVPPGVVMLVPLAAHMVSVQRVRTAPGRGERWALVGALAVILVVAAVASASQGNDLRADGAARASVAALPSGTPVLNSWEEGGYELWRFTELDFVMHGYGDLFTDAEIERNAELTALDPGWQEVVSDLGARDALLEEDSRLASSLIHDRGWRVLARDAQHGATTPRMVHLRAPEAD